jgi:hypothetical protein
MGYRQVYKGNSELKQYYLVNDFSGGINTTDVDNVVADNEFRELLNVELSNRGKLQNRRGFGNLKAFNQLLFENNVDLNRKIGFIKVVKNVGNIIDRLRDFKDADDLRNNAPNFALHILLILENSIRTSDVVLLKVIKNMESPDDPNPNIDVIQKVLYTFDTVADYKDIITAPRTVDYADNIYFSLSSIDNNLKGIANYSISSETFSIIDENNCYSPTPREVTGVYGSTGFNVLSKNPLTNISSEETGIKTIRGMYLTTVGGDLLNKIPSTGDFIVNVLYSGSNFDPYELQITFKNQNDQVLSYNLLSATVSGGLFKYTISNLSRENSNYISIDIEKQKSIKTVQSNAELNPFLGISVGHFVAVGTPPNLKLYLKTETKYEEQALSHYYVSPVGLYYEPSNEASWNSYGVVGGKYDLVGEGIKSLPKPTEYLYNGRPIVGRILKPDGIYDYFTVTVDSPDPYKRWSAFDLYHDQYFVLYYDYPFEYNGRIYNKSFKLYKFDDSKTPDSAKYVFIGHFLAVSTYDDLILKIGEFVRVNDTNKVYRVVSISGVDYTFSEVAYNDNELIIPLLGQLYDVGDINNIAKLEPLDLKDVKITLVGDRLVYYKGNTIWFSELGQFDYLPNTNYIILPLQSNDEITNISYFRNSFIIFTKETIYKMSGTFETDTFNVQMVNEYIGCIAPNSVRSINNSLYFLSRQGLYQLVANNYTDGLENVKKLDVNIKGLIDIDPNYESVLYDEQYWLIRKVNSGLEVIKCYYNMEASNRQSPFSLDSYKHTPDLIFKEGMYVYAIKDGEFYVYDLGNTDFMPYRELTANTHLYTYPCRISMINYSMGYPTHDKKFKNIFIKTKALNFSVLNLTVKIDDYVFIDPYSYKAIVNENGEVEYHKIPDTNKPNVLKLNQATLGNFELGKDVLGYNGTILHKVPVSRKGKTISLVIEQQSNGLFSIEDIGFLYKLGKVKERR